MAMNYSNKKMKFMSFIAQRQTNAKTKSSLPVIIYSSTCIFINRTSFVYVYTWNKSTQIIFVNGCLLHLY